MVAMTPLMSLMKNSTFNFGSFILMLMFSNNHWMSKILWERVNTSDAMEKVDLTGTHEKLQQVREETLQQVEELPFELLNRRTNKTTKLVANSGEYSPMNGSNRWFEYEFSEPVFSAKLR